MIVNNKTVPYGMETMIGLALSNGDGMHNALCKLKCPGKNRKKLFRSIDHKLVTDYTNSCMLP